MSVTQAVDDPKQAESHIASPFVVRVNHLAHAFSFCFGDHRVGKLVGQFSSSDAVSSGQSGSASIPAQRLTREPVA